MPPKLGAFHPSYLMRRHLGDQLHEGRGTECSQRIKSSNAKKEQQRVDGCGEKNQVGA